MQHRPLTANTHNWCDVSTEPGQILVKGGFNRKGASADAIQYRCEDNVTHTFVALHKDAAWFVKGVGGSEKGSLKAVQVLAMLRRKANATDFVSHDTEHCPAVAGSDSQNTTSSAADEADPMESMISTDCVAASLTEFVKKNTKKRKVEKVVRSCVQELTVPLRPACVGTASLEEVTIFVYTPPIKKNAVLHLRVDCISWLLSYAADELACQGVSRASTCSGASPQQPNCPGVDGVCLEWDFDLKRWDATFLAGHAQGDVLHFGASEVTPALFKQLRKMDRVSTWYNKSSTSDMKRAAKEYIILWCNAIVEKKLEEFQNVFLGLLNGESETNANANGAESTADGDAAENADGDDLSASDESDEEGSGAEAAGQLDAGYA